MGYTENPLIIDKKYEGAMKEVDDALTHPKAKAAAQMHGSPLHKFLGMDGKQWANIGVGVAAGAATAFGGPLAGMAVQKVGSGLVDANMEGDDEKAARLQAEKEAAALEEQKKLAANNIDPTPASGMASVAAGPDPISPADITNLTTDPTGASTTGSTAVAKKLGEVKPYYENLKMSAAQYKKAAAMMTVSGVSSLNKKGCYKPK